MESLTGRTLAHYRITTPSAPAGWVRCTGPPGLVRLHAFDGMKEDPRFAALLARLGLP